MRHKKAVRHEDLPREMSVMSVLEPVGGNLSASLTGPWLLFDELEDASSAGPPAEEAFTGSLPADADIVEV